MDPTQRVESGAPSGRDSEGILTHFADLSACTYFGDPSVLLAVGWLEPGHSYNAGAVDGRLIDKIVSLFDDPWDNGLYLGYHVCGFCGFGLNSHSVEYRGRVVVVGQTNLFVPGRDKAYVTPSLVLHYMMSHGTGSSTRRAVSTVCRTTRAADQDCDGDGYNASLSRSRSPHSSWTHAGLVRMVTKDREAVLGMTYRTSVRRRRRPRAAPIPGWRSRRTWRRLGSP